MERYVSIEISFPNENESEMDFVERTIDVAYEGDFIPNALWHDLSAFVQDWINKNGGKVVDTVLERD